MTERPGGPRVNSVRSVKSAREQQRRSDASSDAYSVPVKASEEVSDGFSTSEPMTDASDALDGTPADSVADGAVTVSQKVAATLCGLGVVGEFERRHRGEDPEVAVTLFQLKKAARDYTRFHSEQFPRTAPRPDTLVSTTQAAQILGIERQSVTRRIRNGTLPAVLIGGRWAVSLSDLAA